MKKFFKYLMVASIIAVVLVMIITHNKSIADVGSFEDYDSGSSWDDDYDSGSSWDDDYDSGSSWDDDWDRGSSLDSTSSSDDSSSSGGSSHEMTPIGWLFVFSPLIIWLFVVIISQINNVTNNKNRNRSKYVESKKTIDNDYPEKYTQYKEESLVEAIKKNVVEFNRAEFLDWAGRLFIQTQGIWKTGNLNSIRRYETTELYEQQSKQYKDYIDRDLVNVKDAISIQTIRLAEFNQSGEKDVLTVVLQYKMYDYIIKKTTGNIVRGDKETFKYGIYKMEFIRRTNEISSSKNAKCPNCGAQLMSEGKCEYCGSTITNEEYNWALSSLERIK